MEKTLAELKDLASDYPHIRWQMKEMLIDEERNEERNEKDTNSLFFLLLDEIDPNLSEREQIRQLIHALEDGSILQSYTQEEVESAHELAKRQLEILEKWEGISTK